MCWVKNLWGMLCTAYPILIPNMQTRPDNENTRGECTSLEKQTRSTKKYAPAMCNGEWKDQKKQTSKSNYFVALPKEEEETSLEKEIHLDDQDECSLPLAWFLEWAWEKEELMRVAQIMIRGEKMLVERSRNYLWIPNNKTHKISILMSLGSSAFVTTLLRLRRRAKTCPQSLDDHHKL